MADVRRVRRDAEKAAREALSGTLVDKAGALGVALAGQAEATETVTTARAKAATLIEAAHAEGAALITSAQADASTADDAYAAAWNASKQAGWTPAQLRAMGYPKPPAGRRPTSIAPSDAGTDSVAPMPAPQGEYDTEHVA